MKFQLLPSTFDENGRASARQHLACFIINDNVAFDAGSLAMSVSDLQRDQIRDVILSHAHLDHIAGLPLFIDDLFANLEKPICVHAAREVVEILESDIFNWRIYPRFSELQNQYGTVMKYSLFEVGKEFTVRNLQIKAVQVNHLVPAVGFIIKDGETTVALSNDTAQMTDFWDIAAAQKKLSAILIECAFPDELSEIAASSHHLTPGGLAKELEKLTDKSVPVYVVNLKPMYHSEIVKQIKMLKIDNLQILEAGKVYNF